MIIHLIEELSLDYDERHPDRAFTDRERAALNHAVKPMIAEGLVEVDDPEPMNTQG